MRRLRTIPDFVDEDAERSFWSKADSTDHVDWSRARRLILERLEAARTRKEDRLRPEYDFRNGRSNPYVQRDARTPFMPKPALLPEPNRAFLPTDRPMEDPTDPSGWAAHICADPFVCHGQARIRGTRIPVSVVLDNLAGGESWSSIARRYPGAAPLAIRACLDYASYLVQGGAPISANRSRNRRKIVVTRLGSPEPPGDYADFTPAERVGLAWETTLSAWSFREPDVAERRISRAAVCVVDRRG